MVKRPIRNPYPARRARMAVVAQSWLVRVVKG